MRTFVQPLLSVRSWNYRLLQCLNCLIMGVTAAGEESRVQKMWLYIGIVVLAQFVVPTSAGMQQIVSTKGDGVFVGDYRSAFRALDCALDLFMLGDYGDEKKQENLIEDIFVYIYDITILEFLVCSLKMRKKPECMKAAIRLISRRELARSANQEQVYEYMSKLQRNFLRKIIQRLFQ
ncbi:hypothetical protein HK100_012455 [Physocladia obscura]|uniref:Uncharacterized protein n=1 Tax=Physocladia obscura TaxID=109957 RepID=A0AAD5XFW1_9FUNG|nr:hypothetical protein HK100_012455 [Physocladia obscura]